MGASGGLAHHAQHTGSVPGLTHATLTTAHSQLHFPGNRILKRICHKPLTRTDHLMRGQVDTLFWVQGTVSNGLSLQLLGELHWYDFSVDSL